MTAPGIPALLEPIQKRLDAATPGPWESKGIANGRSDLFANGDYYGGKKSVATAADSEFGPCSDNDAEFIAAAPTDTARLLAAVKAVVALHRPVKIYDECECPEGTHPEDYDYFDCQDYSGCHNSISGIGCEECCVDDDYLSQACGESHAHTMNESERCPTVSAVVAALRGEA